MADGSYRFSISVEGGDAGTRALAAVADGQERVASTGDRAASAMGRTAQAATGSGGLLSAWGRIDDGAGKVMRSMGGLNDVLDIAKLALGVGLSGPIGAVVTGLGELLGMTDLVKGMFGDASNAAAALAKGQDEAAAAARDHAKALGELATAGRNMAGGRLGVDPSTLSGDALVRGIALQREMNKLEAEQVKNRAALVSSMEDLEGFDSGKRGDANQRRIDRLQAIMSPTNEQYLELREAMAASKQREAGLALEQIEYNQLLRDANKLREERIRLESAAVALFPRTDATPPRSTPTRGTPRGAAPKAKTDPRAKADDKADDKADPVVPGPLFDAARVAEAQAQIVELWAEWERGEGAMILPDVGKTFGDVLGEFTQAAMDATENATLIASAVQQIAGAIGTSMGDMVAGVGKGSKGLKTSIGDIALMLSRQAFTFATYLAAMGVVASIPGLQVLTAAMTGGATAPTLFAAAGVMGGVGAALGLTARAMGTSQSGGSGSARASSGAGSSGGGGGGSSGGGFGSFGQSSDRPIEVTVILSADALHDSAVSVSGQRARSGSISAPRLAVAGGF